MTPFEQKTIGTILDNACLKEEDKARYAAAFLLMAEKEQKAFVRKWEQFQQKCGAIRINAGQAGTLTALFRSIKDRLLLKKNHKPA